MNIDIVITGHREGTWIGAAILSALNNQTKLFDYGVDSDVKVFLDNPDELTLSVANGFLSRVTVEVLDFRDVCKVRNFAVQATSATHVAFLDGDDIWGSDWLRLVCKFLETQAPHAHSASILHPQFSYCFGTKTIDSRVVMEHISTDDNRFDPFTLVSANPWSALCFAPTQILRKFPYRSSSLELNTGFEDWTFNIETYASGISHLVVPNTIHFHRRKETGSRLTSESGRDATYYPNRFWQSLASSS